MLGRLDEERRWELTTTRHLPPELVTLIEHVALNEAGWSGVGIQRFVLATIWLEDEPLHRDALPAAIDSAFGVSFSPAELAGPIDTLVETGDLKQLADGRVRIPEETATDFEASLSRTIAGDEEMQARVNAALPDADTDLEPVDEPDTKRRHADSHGQPDPGPSNVHELGTDQPDYGDNSSNAQCRPGSQTGDTRPADPRRHPLRGRGSDSEHRGRGIANRCHPQTKPNPATNDVSHQLNSGSLRRSRAGDIVEHARATTTVESLKAENCPTEDSTNEHGGPRQHEPHDQTWHPALDPLAHLIGPRETPTWRRVHSTTRHSPF